MMYRYQIIEEILYLNLYTKDLVELIFKYLYPIHQNIKREIKIELLKEIKYCFIENYKLGDAQKGKKIVRCSICNAIIKTKGNEIYFYDYLDCMEHNKKVHNKTLSYNETILEYVSNL